MTWPPCGLPDCPVRPPTTAITKHLKTTTVPHGDELYRCVPTGHAAESLVPGLGNSRFAPLEGRHHTYVGWTKTAAILESALHEANGPNPAVYLAQLGKWQLASLVFDTTIRLYDLRDEALASLGLDRTELTATSPRHYPCSRAWASELAGRSVGGYQTHGLIWTSRQGDLHAQANQAGLAADLLRHRAIDAAVVWAPPFDGRLRSTSEPVPLVNGREPIRLVNELANLIGVAIL